MLVSASPAERAESAPLHMPHAGTHRLNRFSGALLDCPHGLVDLLGCFAGALCEPADLARNNRKSATMNAGARRFNRCVEREQICLACNFVDHADDLADGVAGASQPFNLRRSFLVGFQQLADRLP